MSLTMYWVIIRRRFTFTRLSEDSSGRGWNINLSPKRIQQTMDCGIGLATKGAQEARHPGSRRGAPASCRMFSSGKCKRLYVTTSPTTWRKIHYRRNTCCLKGFWIRGPVLSRGESPTGDGHLTVLPNETFAGTPTRLAPISRLLSQRRSGMPTAWRSTDSGAPEKRRCSLSRSCRQPNRHP